jgi:transposase
LIWRGKQLSRAKTSFSPQFREEAVRLVIEGSRPIASVARELGIGEGTLGNWVAAYRREHAGDEPPLNISERERLRQLEREARELRMENEFLKKVAMTARFAVTGRYENLPVAVRADVGAA